MSAIIDFETRSTCDLKTSDAWVYSNHPDTHVLCLGYKIEENTTKLWKKGDEAPQDLFDYIKAGGTIEAHNWLFEYCIWNNFCVNTLNWIPLPPSQIMCIAAKAATFALPRSLDGLGKALNLEVQKDKEGHRVMLQLTKPKKPSKKDPSLWYDDKERFNKLYDYCIRDVDAEYAVSREMFSMLEYERPIFELDKKVNLHGVYIDKELVQKAINLCELHIEYQTQLLSELTSNVVKSANQRDVLLQWLKDNNCNIPDLTSRSVQDYLDNKNNIKHGTAYQVLQIRQQLSKNSVKKLYTMLSMLGEDNRIRGTLLYHGASTGRWSGKGIQPQNFPKGSEAQESIIQDVLTLPYKEYRDKYNDVLSSISLILRGCICAAPGNTLLCADYSSIESRVLFWLANEKQGIDIYASHGNIYEHMAGLIFNKKPEEIVKGSMERQLGKQAILGLGYGMGIPKFKATCDAYNIDVTDELAAIAVEKYRSSFANVCNLWKHVEYYAQLAVKYPNNVVKVNDKIAFKCVGDQLFCRLPSGRFLTYNYPKVVKEKRREVLTFMGIDTYTKKWCEQTTYGGKLVENITQAVARDLMAEAMIRLDKAGFCVIMTVHDEIVSEEIAQPFEKTEQFENIMKECPTWAKGCPIEVEGWEGKRYKK